MKTDFSYEGKDLESMNFAIQYHCWILDQFKPFLGKTTVEVGAGSGSFTSLLCKAGPNKVIAIEPSEEMFPLLQKTVKHLNSSRVETFAYKGFFSDQKTKVQKHRPDSIVYVNVFEHIEQDEKELEQLYKALPKGGRVCIFVPANKWLMSNFDKKIGHFRRYTKKELVQKVVDAGFEIQVVKRFDMVGMIPWLIKYRIFGSTSMEPGLTKVFDKVVVPVESRIEKLISPPFGKNLVLVASKH